MGSGAICVDSAVQRWKMLLPTKTMGPAGAAPTAGAGATDAIASAATTGRIIGSRRRDMPRIVMETSRRGKIRRFSKRHPSEYQHANPPEDYFCRLTAVVRRCPRTGAVADPAAAESRDQRRSLLRGHRRQLVHGNHRRRRQPSRPRRRLAADVKAAYVRNNSSGELKAESIALAFQGAKILTPKLSIFGKYGFLHDRFAGIESRNTVAAGEAYILLETKRNKLTVDGALGYASEERTISPTTKNGTWDMGVLYDWKLSDNAEITDDARILFSLSDGNDWRAGNIASLSAKLTTDVLAQDVQYHSLREPARARLPEDRHDHGGCARREILTDDAPRRPRFARLLSH